MVSRGLASGLRVCVGGALIEVTWGIAAGVIPRPCHRGRRRACVGKGASNPLEKTWARGDASCRMCWRCQSNDGAYVCMCIIDVFRGRV